MDRGQTEDRQRRIEDWRTDRRGSRNSYLDKGNKILVRKWISQVVLDLAELVWSVLTISKPLKYLGGTLVPNDIKVADKGKY